ncbi:hypothetical protein Tco_0950637 [Tanacetum coccineum]
MSCTDKMMNRICDNASSPMINMHELKIRDKFLKILRDNAFNGMDGGDGTTISWDELKEQFFHKYYPLSKTRNSRTPNDLDNGTDYFEFLYWLASKFDKHWEIDKTTRCGLWEFNVNERTKGTIGDLHDEPRDESSHMTYSDWFYKPHLYTYGENENFQIIDKEGSPILGPARHNICDQDKLCSTEEFSIVRYSMGLDKEFIAVEPGKISTVKRTTRACLTSTITSSIKGITDGWITYGVSKKYELHERLLTFMQDLAEMKFDFKREYSKN